MGSGSIRLRRLKASRDIMRRYKVLVDGDEVGYIKQSQEWGFAVPAGNHTLQLKIDWCSSKPISFTLAEGETVGFVCVGGDFLHLLDIIFSRNDYIQLERT